MPASSSTTPLPNTVRSTSNDQDNYRCSAGNYTEWVGTWKQATPSEMTQPVPNMFAVTLTKETGSAGEPGDPAPKARDVVIVYVHPDGLADFLGLDGATVLCKGGGTNWSPEMCGA